VFERITFDPKIMGGRACIRGMRIPVAVIVGQIAHGATFEEILQGYPDLERADPTGPRIRCLARTRGSPHSLGETRTIPRRPNGFAVTDTMRYIFVKRGCT